MNISIRYYSPNEKSDISTITTAISDVLSVESRRLIVPLTEDTDILFLGCSVGTPGFSRNLKKFLSKNNVSVRIIVNYTTNTFFKKRSTYKKVRKIARLYNIHVCSREFRCRGSWGPFFRNRPNEIDMKEAAAFAQDVVTYIRERMAAPKEPVNK